MTLPQYLAAGGRREDLAWDIAKGHCILVGGDGAAASLPKALPFGGRSPGVPRVARPAANDTHARKVYNMRASDGWVCELVYEPRIITIRESPKDKEGKKAIWRELKYEVFISPKGHRYVRALPHEPADLLHMGFTRRPPPEAPLRFIKVKHSAMVQKDARRAASLQREEQERAKAERIATSTSHLAATTPVKGRRAPVPPPAKPSQRRRTL